MYSTARAAAQTAKRGERRAPQGKSAAGTETLAELKVFPRPLCYQPSYSFGNKNSREWPNEYEAGAHRLYTV